MTNESPRYFFGRDNSGHWYLVDAAIRREWEAWTALSEDDERAWFAPEGAQILARALTLYTFTDPRTEP